MDWIHCNSCFHQPFQQKEKDKRSFILTSCGHIFCNSCENQSSIESCQVCGSKCSTMKLQSEMKPEVQDYFTDPEEMVKKLSNTMEFQRNHRQRLNEAIRKMSSKYQLAKLYIHRLEDELKTTKRELEYYKRSLTDASPADSSSFLQTPNSAFSQQQQMRMKSQQQRVSTPRGIYRNSNKVARNSNFFQYRSSNPVQRSPEDIAASPNTPDLINQARGFAETSSGGYSYAIGKTPYNLKYLTLAEKTKPN